MLLANKIAGALTICNIICYDCLLIYLPNQIEGLTIGSLDDIPAGPVTTFFRSVRSTLDFDFEDENEGWLNEFTCHVASWHFD